MNKVIYYLFSVIMTSGIVSGIIVLCQYVTESYTATTGGNTEVIRYDLSPISIACILYVIVLCSAALIYISAKYKANK